MPDESCNLHRLEYLGVSFQDRTLRLYLCCQRHFLLFREDWSLFKFLKKERLNVFNKFNIKIKNRDINNFTKFEYNKNQVENIYVLDSFAEIVHKSLSMI